MQADQTGSQHAGTDASAQDHEARRLAALQRYHILDTPPEESFDRITRLAADLFNVPIATITLIDERRQWFKSAIGLTSRESDREIAFCSHAIERGEVCLVPDALHDPRFARNPLVLGDPNIRFYAGAPLTTSDGFRLGTLCIIDRVPRPGFSSAEQQILVNLAAIVVRELELHRELDTRSVVEASLAESEARFRAAMEQSPMGMALISCTGQWLQSNHALQAMLGYSEAELDQLTLQDITHPDDLERTEAQIASLLAGTESSYRVEKRFRHRNGHFVWVEKFMSIVRAPDGRPRYFITQFHDIEERRQADARLRESQERFRASFENAAHGIAIVSTGGRWLKVNRALCDLLGYSEQELLATDFQSLTHPDDLAIDLAQAQAVVAGDLNSYGMEKRYFRKNGDIVWIHLSVSLVRDENGAPLYFISHIQNIHDRKMSDEKIEHLIERNRLANEAGKIGIWEWLVDSGHVVWDAGMYRLYGQEGSDLTPAQIWEKSVHPDDIMAQRAHFARVLAEGDEIDTEFRIIWPNQELRYIRTKGQIVCDVDGKPLRIVGINWDITELRGLANRLAVEKQALEDAHRQISRQNEERGILTEATATGLLIVDRHGKITFANSIAEKLFGYPSADLIGQTIEMLVPSKLRRAHLAHRTGWHGSAEIVRRLGTGIDVSAVDKSGTEIPLHVQLRTSDSQKGAVTVATIFDLRPRMAAEQALKEAKEAAETANRAKSEFLTVMSHELRTPMNGILGFTQLLDSELFGKLNDKQKEFAVAILNSGQHLLKLIDDVLELSKIEAGKLSVSIEAAELVPICKSVMASLTQFAGRYGINIDIGNGGLGMPLVMIDRTRVAQCLYNFGSNAVKYNRPNGKVAFSYDLVGNDFVRISVTDTGIGIPAARQNELFQPFNRLGAEQKAIEGTGVGLALTRRIAHLMGGDVGFTSESGEGSTFWIDLPRAKLKDAEEAATPTQITPVVMLRRSGFKILYVEDNPMNQALIRNICMTFKGVTLVMAADGASGLEMARREQPDIILLDINLPDQNGFALLLELKKDPTFALTPVMALSANAMPRQVKQGLEAGFFRYLLKPLVVSSLIDAINAALDYVTDARERGQKSIHHG